MGVQYIFALLPPSALFRWQLCFTVLLQSSPQPTVNMAAEPRETTPVSEHNVEKTEHNNVEYREKSDAEALTEDEEDEPV